MKNNVREVKQSGIKSIKLELEHVRNVLERKPVRRRPMGESPFQIVQRYAAVDLRDFVNVFGIVEVDERELDRLPEHEPNERDEPGADAGNDSALGNVTAHFANSDRATARGAGKDRHRVRFRWPD